MTEFRRNLAVVIGIDHYQNGIQPLKTAAADAQKLADILRSHHDYQLIHLDPTQQAPILNETATLENLRQLFTDILPNQIRPNHGDRLLIYFAGHGITRNINDTGPQGFLIPQDADIKNADSLLPMQELYKSFHQLECRHLLVILDCCFAGMFRWSNTRKANVIPETIHWEHYHRFIKYPAWQVITSAAYNQTALDYVDNRGEGSHEQHSPFAEALFEGLLERKADLIPDGVITTPELYLYLRECVEKRSQEQQTPGYWPLSKHDRGEYIFQLVPEDQLKLKPAPKLEKDNNPYRGLEAFEERHARFFFGREEVVKSLVIHISRPGQQFTVVDGISGSGKSSVVKGGLLPKLREKPDSPWQILPVIRPGTDPYIALASVICPPQEATSERLKQISGQLKNSPEDFYEQVVSWGKQNPDKKLLLVVDQFEELITLEPRKISAVQEKKRFSLRVFNFWKKSESKEHLEQQESEPRWQTLTNLLANVLKTCPQLHLIVTIRSDFSPRFQESALGPKWAQARFVVRPMRSDELRETVIGPANEMALYFEPPELVDRLVDEVAQTPGALPLLSFTLSELYLKLYKAWRIEGKEDRALTVDDEFDGQGGVAGLLARRANEEYGQLPDNEHRATMRRVMLRMVELEGAEAVKRRVSRTELVYSTEAENARVEMVLNLLDQARLIVGGDEAGEAYVEPSHDFLVRGWDTLQDWIREDQENLSLRQLVSPAAKNWKHTQSDLWNTNSRLDQLCVVTQSKQNWLNLLESTFVERSFKLRERNKRYRRLAIASAFLGISSVATISLIQNINNQLKVSSTTVLEKFKAKEELSAALESLDIGWRVQTLKKWPTLIDDSSQLQVIDTLQKILYNITEINHFSSEHNITGMNFSPNGEYIIATYGSNHVKIWETSGRVKSTFQVSEIGSSEVNSLGEWVPRSLTISNSGERIAIRLDDKRASILDGSGNVIRNLQFNGRQIEDIAFNSSGDNFLVLTRLVDDCKIHLIPTNSGGESSVSGCWVDISSDGEELISIDRNGHITLFDWSGIKSLEWDIPINKEETDFSWSKNIIEFSPNGERIAIANRDGIVFWNKAGEQIGRLDIAAPNSQQLIRNNRFISDSFFATATEDGDVALWRLPTDNQYWSSSINQVSQWPQNLVNVDLFGNTSSENQILIISNSKLARDLSDASIWDWKQQKTIDLQSQLNTYTFNEHNKMMISSRWERTKGQSTNLRLWDISKKQVFQLNGNSIAFSSDPTLLAIGDSSGEVKIMGTDDKEPVVLKAQEWIGATCRTGCTHHMAFSADTSHLLTAGGESGGKIWDLSGEMIWENSANIGYVKDVQFSAGRNAFFIASEGTEQQRSVIQIIPQKIHADSMEVEASKTINISQSNITSLSVMRGKDMFLSASSDGSAGLYDFTGQEIASFPHPLSVNKVVLSPNEEILATASDDRQIRLWEIDGTLKMTFPAQSGTIRNLKFSPDGKSIISSSSDGFIKFWDLNGREVFGTRATENWQAAYFSQDLNRIAFIKDFDNHGGVIELWSLDLDSLLVDICRWLDSYLSTDLSTLQNQKKRCQEIHPSPS